MHYYKTADTHSKFNSGIKCSCGENITAKQCMFECSTCKKWYHPGCKGIVGGHITSKASKPNWYCSPECDITNLETKLDNFSTDLSDIKTILETKFQELQKSQEFLSTQFDDIKEKYEQVLSDNKNLKKELQKEKLINKHNTERINKMDVILDHRNQCEKRNNLIVCGLPNSSIDPVTIVTDIFKNIGCEELINETSSIEYVEPRRQVNSNAGNTVNSSKSRPVTYQLLVKFKDMKFKQQMYEKKKGRMIFTNQLGYNLKTDRQIFMRDHLTSFQLNLYRKAQQLKHLLKFEFLYINKSSILFRKNRTSKMYRITSWNDIQEIMEAHNLHEIYGTFTQSSDNQAMEADDNQITNETQTSS